MIPRFPAVRIGRTCSLAVAALLAFACLLSGPRAQGAELQEGRVVVVGFDGADSRMTARLMAEGRLPNLARLAEEGTFAPLVSTNPAESAAGWAALNTGTNPLKNNVPSFIKRDPRGEPIPVPAHTYQGSMVIDVPAGGQALGSILAALERSSPLSTDLTAGLIVAVVSLVFFMLVFKLFLGVSTGISLVLSILLCVSGGAATHIWVGDRAASGGGSYEVPDVYFNPVKQPGFWDIAARGGKRAIVLDAALAFGQETVPGARVLAGLGLPDVRGAGNGNWFIYTTDDIEVHRTPKGWTSPKGSGTGTTFRVDERGGRIETEVYGPVNFAKRVPIEAEIAELNERLKDPDLGWKAGGQLRDERKVLETQLKGMTGSPWEHRVSLPMVLERKGDELEITIAGDTQTAAEGQWTGWFRLPFELAPGLVAGGITRARVMQLGDITEVYLHSFDIDPENPPVWQPVSQPASFSAELAGWAGGPYETLGWSCMTNQLKDKMLPVDVFLEDIEFTMAWRERLTRAVLGRDDWDLLFSVFSTTDRVQHMMYKYHDPLHPLYRAQEAAREVEFFGEPTALADVVPAIYEQMDRIVGMIREQLQPQDTLMLCADHGFTSYRRGLEVNNWLTEQGYMVLKDNLTSTNMGLLWSGVDWSRTRAYGLGLGMIYLNMEGREGMGMVPKAEGKALLKEIGDKLVALRDSGPEDRPFEQPMSVVRDYQIMDDLYKGPVEWGALDYPCADMQIGFDEFYRSSWGSVSGKIKLVKDADGQVVLGPIYKANSNNWSGDHASNSPQLVTGIFFSSEKLAVPEGGVSVMHIAPTVLRQLGVEIPEIFDLQPLSTHD